MLRLGIKPRDPYRVIFVFIINEAVAGNDPFADDGVFRVFKAVTS
jgi:hypothetical protein